VTNKRGLGELGPLLPPAMICNILSFMAFAEGGAGVMKPILSLHIVCSWINCGDPFTAPLASMKIPTSVRSEALSASVSG
jgi:hypothetical protein